MCLSLTPSQTPMPESIAFESIAFEWSTKSAWLGISLLNSDSLRGGRVRIEVTGWTTTLNFTYSKIVGPQSATIFTVLAHAT